MTKWPKNDQMTKSANDEFVGDRVDSEKYGI